jgi:tRNA threonylcarbamoyladenosine biosynthesis protein TsaB
MSGFNRMKILLIDTCGTTGSVALADTNLSPAIVAITSLPGRTASERLVPAIKQLTLSGGFELRSLDAIAVVSGPGSFTGVRVGLSAAKGLCEALNVPLVAISRLAVLAHLAAAPPAARVHALLDAGRGEFYHGEYIDGICLCEALLTRDELLAALAQSSPGLGSVEPAAVVVASEQSVAQSVAALTPHLVADPTAEDALPLALRSIHQRDFDNPATLDANYLRRTDAQIFAKPCASAPLRPDPARIHPGAPANE